MKIGAPASGRFVAAAGQQTGTTNPLFAEWKRTHVKIWVNAARFFSARAKTMRCCVQNRGSPSGTSWKIVIWLFRQLFSPQMCV